MMIDLMDASHVYPLHPDAPRGPYYPNTDWQGPMLEDIVLQCLQLRQTVFEPFAREALYNEMLLQAYEHPWVPADAGHLEVSGYLLGIQAAAMAQHVQHLDLGERLLAGVAAFFQPCGLYMAAWRSRQEGLPCPVLTTALTDRTRDVVLQSPLQTLLGLNEAAGELLAAALGMPLNPLYGGHATPVQRARLREAVHTATVSIAPVFGAALERARQATGTARQVQGASGSAAGLLQ